MPEQNLRPLRVAIVAPSLRILGGQSVQAERLLHGWANDPEIAARLVPTNPLPPGVLPAGIRIKYVPTVVTQLTFWPLLVREIWKADVVNAFSSYASFVLSTLPAMVIGRLLRRPVLMHYHSGEADAGGVPSILTDGVHRLLARRDGHRAVADRIIELLRQPGRASHLASNAYASCSRYTWSAVRAQWLALYRELAAPIAVPAPTTA